MFETQLSEVIVKLEVVQGGQTETLTHHLRPPTSQEWIDFDRKSSQVESRRGKVKIENTNLEARAWLYDQIVMNVDGYGYNGQSLIPDIPNWKAAIPLLHKSQVIGYFNQVYIQDADDEKNSGSESGKP